jgi:hypothetical protein
VSIHHPYLDNKDHSQEEMESWQEERSITEGEAVGWLWGSSTLGNHGPVTRPSAPPMLTPDVGKGALFLNSLIMYSHKRSRL